jgi:hypothetical protein
MRTLRSIAQGSALAAALAVGLVAPAVAQEAPAPKGPEVPADLRLYSEASLQMHRQNHAQALKLFDDLLAKHSASQMAVEARFWRANCLEELGRREEARVGYQALIHHHGATGWAKDAKRRLAAMAAGSHTTASTTGRRVIVLANGDRVSGTVVGQGKGLLKVEADGVGSLAMPRDHVAGVYRLEDGAEGDVELAADVEIEGDVEFEIDDGETETIVEKDGVKTITKVGPNGRKTVTTIREGKDGRKTVTVRVAGDEGEQEEERIELKLDNLELDELHERLGDLPKKPRRPGGRGARPGWARGLARADPRARPARAAR